MPRSPSQTRPCRLSSRAPRVWHIDKIRAMKIRTSAWISFGVCIALLPVAADAAGQAAADPASIAAEHLGTVSFPVSCSPSVQASFNRGIALVHDFWYEEARPQFEKIVAADPSCAMAHWGIAMS